MKNPPFSQICRLIQTFLLSLLLFPFVAIPGLQAEEALRIYIRSSEKTHGPGQHDYPSFLKDWTALLTERGMKATGADRFPTQEELEATDVLVIHAKDGGDLNLRERKDFEAFLQRGGGVVAVHAGTVSKDPDWYKTVIGGSWRHGKTKWLEGPMSLYFTDRENAITDGLSNFDLDDELYYDMDLLPEVRVLAAAYTPNPKDPANQEVGEHVNIYDIQPQLWTYEVADRRAVGFIPGHRYENFSHPSIRAMLLRSIAWAGKRAEANTYLTEAESADLLRYPEGGPTHPSKAGEKIELHSEFELSLVAAEPLINKVLNVDWDEKGRLWVVESPEYPNGLRKANTDEWKDSGSVAPGKYEREPLDRISILSDTDGDGVMDRKHVFADKLELATSFVLHQNGVIVAAAPDIWFLEDTDGDEVADKRTKLYTGLGTFDTHATLNNLRWGRDGWIYGTHGYSAGDAVALGAAGEKEPVRIGSGVVRFKADGSHIEMYSSKNGNSWGLNMTSDGQNFWTQPTSGVLFFHTVLPEYVLAKGKLPEVNSWHGMLERTKVFPHLNSDQLPYVQIDLVGSYTAAAGCAIYEGGAWPDRWHYSYFTGEPTINIVSHHFVKPDGVTYQAMREEGREETEFIRSSDLWFRPVDTRIGPDGALYVTDFYNQAVIHNDTRGPLHGPANAAVRPDRDHYFGRIWRVHHKESRTVEVPVLDRGDKEALKAALGHANAHTKLTAERLLREAGESVEVPHASKPYQRYLDAAAAATPEARLEVINSYGSAEDKWTRTAIIAATSDQATTYLEEILAAEPVKDIEQLVTAILPRVLDGIAPDELTALLTRVAEAAESLRPVQRAILTHLASRPQLNPTANEHLNAALTTMSSWEGLDEVVLPLIIRWDQANTLQDLVETKVSALTLRLRDAEANEEVRASAGRALAVIGSSGGLAAIGEVLAAPGGSKLKETLIAALSQSGRQELLVAQYHALDQALRRKAFDEILKRPEACLALIARAEAGEISAADIESGNVARLRTHPDAGVSEAAIAAMDKLVPGAKEKNQLIQQLLAVVSQTGDVAQGKILYTGACAICHKYEDLGVADVGPPLTGMGSHGAAELLTAIVDPNREVDPSFWQWNITLKSGDTHAGVIVSENQASLRLRHQGGDVEIPKSDIAQRVNTQRSMMPEGLEAMGGEALRDIIAYMMADDSRYRVLDLRSAYTADNRRGLFASHDNRGDSVFPERFGHLEVEGVPFFLMEARRSPNGRNLVVLKGGGKGHVASDYPRSVDIPVNLEASRFYLMSGIAGWGYPAVSDRRLALKVVLRFADGTEEITELRNGVEFGDYVREMELPGSKLLQGVVRRGQIRLIEVPVRKKAEVVSLRLESYDNQVTPVVMSITADLAREAAEITTTAWHADPTSTEATGASFREPRVADEKRVLIVGAGSSHHFPRYFLHQDSVTLREAGGFDVAATPNLKEALALLPQADVLIFSGNDPQYGQGEFMGALRQFADAGKGIVLLHAATWHNYPALTGYNERFVAGGTKSHGRGDIDVTVLAKHPVTEGVAQAFRMWDESYHHVVDFPERVEILVENGPDDKIDQKHPSVWVVKDPKTRIVCMTFGHDARSHEHPDYQRLLINSVKWVSQ